MPDIKSAFTGSNVLLIYGKVIKGKTILALVLMVLYIAFFLIELISILFSAQYSI